MPWQPLDEFDYFPSLGWGLVDWWQTHFKVPAGEHYGKPFQLTPEQVEFFVRLYRLDPETGQRVVRRASRRGSKGKGKSPEGALFVGAEFCGPVVFDGWDANGQPVARPREFPWVQVAAVSEEQTGNLYLVLREMLAESDLIDEQGIDLGKTRIEFKDGRPGRVEPVTASAGAREGQPITAAVLEETHLWLPGQHGDRMAAVLRRNAAKTGGVTLETTNAPALGENSVAEATLDAAAKQTGLGVLYDSMEGSWPAELDPKHPDHRDRVMQALDEAYGDAGKHRGGWVDLDRIYEEILDPGTTRADVLRFYFNIAAKAESRAFDPADIEATRSERAVEGPCVLMFDGARTRDCAVLSAWTTDETPHHFAVKVWERPPNADANYEHPRGEIRAAVRQFIASHDCALFVYDESFHELSSLYDEWVDEFGEANPGKGTGMMVGYPTASGKRMEAAIKRVLEDFKERLFTHDGDPAITAHLTNAVLDRNRGGWLTLAKEKDSLKIDGAVTFTFGYDMIPTARELASNKIPADVWAIVD